ncbi:MAG: 30S ribosomal protein S16 [bacterium]|nr:30S ribosomal protein S16 [bacterium]
MLSIRLTRRGKKNQPFFRVIVIDKRRSSKGGRAVEVLGYVDPLTKRKSIKKERVQYWLSKGAQPSATMHNLLVQEKIIEGEKVHVSRIKKSKLAEIAAEKAKAAEKVAATPAPVPAPVETEAPIAETPKEEPKLIEPEKIAEPVQNPE